ncbi:MAG: Rrf2 family transcriptional regulator [Acidobacteriota bacterium]
MILSKATAYGIRALVYLANHSDSTLCSLQEIAESEQIPPVYLRKLLGELRRHRLLRSVKGIHGGYELLRAPQSITLWEVFRVLEPDPYLDSCILACGVCQSPNSCALHEDWQQWRQSLLALLQKKTIAELASSKRSYQTVEIAEI